ncbi:uncharacterized protein LOC123525503 [Mercenaria mercenaria]|uniref:uncharacterized protein LOC123525503 n=1 Tax=Mercenaria mercenaria TaxID=6596 RepID=UPI00234F72C1|nr:uncharacterized protein LOC123525503 [Mercenaria mercenaria]
MAYLVIVHVPYTPFTEVEEKKGDTCINKSVIQTREEENQLTVDSGIADNNKLESDQDKEVDEEGSANLTDAVSVSNDDVEGPAKENTSKQNEDTPIPNGEVERPAGESTEGTEEESIPGQGESETDKDTNIEGSRVLQNDKEDESEDIIGKCVEPEIGAGREDPEKDVEEDKAPESLSEDDSPLTPLFQKIPIHRRVEQELIKMEVNNVDIRTVGCGTYQKFSFVQNDSKRCEQILNRLKGIGVGITAGSSVSVFPSSVHEWVEPEVEDKLTNVEGADEDSPGKKKEDEEQVHKESQFKKSVKSRLLVAQVVKSVKANALFTFDYLVLLILASIIACIGLVENSSVVLVASMLISPLMGPILAATFGQVIRKKDLRDLGLKSEMKGLALCLVVGFTFGLISGGVGLHGAIWGSSDSYPTMEMRSRGMWRSLWVGVLIAIPSGAAVAISVLGGNAGSLVGVAISASLLPPACNAGMLWAYSILAAIRPPAVKAVSSVTMETIATTAATAVVNSTQSAINSSVFTNVTSTTPISVITTEVLPADGCPPLVDNMYKEVYFCNMAHEAALLGLISLLLTVVNICCIIVIAIFVLKIKEVAPNTAGSGTFWREDVQVARDYYSTAKGEDSVSLGKKFLEEYKKIQAEKKKEKNKDEDSSDESMDDNYAAIEMHDMLEDVENSPDCLELYSKLQNFRTERIAEDLSREYYKATMNITNKLAKRPGVYLADHSVRDSSFHRAYNTIHHVPSTERAGLAELRDKFKSRKVPSMYIEPTYNQANEVGVGNAKQSRPRSSLGLTSGLFKRRKKVKFEVTKVEEEQELV